jgi:hypothetical protein
VGFFFFFFFFLLAVFFLFCTSPSRHAVTSSNATTRIVGYELGVAPYRVEVATQTTAMVASIENPLKHVVFSPSVANMLTEKLQIATKHCVLYPPLYVQRVPTMSYRERMGDLSARVAQVCRRHCVAPLCASRGRR